MRCPPSPAARVAAIGLAVIGLPIVLVATAAGVAGAASPGIAGKTPAQILAAVKKAEQSVRGVHMAGTIEDGGETITFDLDVGRAGNGLGTFTDQGQALRVRKVRADLYVYANRAFWAKNGNGATAGQLGGKWIATTIANPDFGTLAQFFGVSRLTTQLFPADSGPITKGAAVTVGGRPTLPLTSVVKKKGRVTQTTTLYVLTTGTPFVVKSTARNGTETGTIVFSHYGRRVAVNAPPRSVDLSQVTGGSTTTTPTTAPG